MNSHRLFTFKVCQPSKTKSQGSAWFFWISNVLMESLERSNCKIPGRNQARFPHHLSFIGTVPVKRYQQRRIRLRRWPEVVIKIDLCFESSVEVVGHVHKVFIVPYPERCQWYSNSGSPLTLRWIGSFTAESLSRREGLETLFGSPWLHQAQMKARIGFQFRIPRTQV